MEKFAVSVDAKEERSSPFGAQILQPTLSFRSENVFRSCSSYQYQFIANEEA